MENETKTQENVGADTISPGDVVTLRSGGLPMTVLRVTDQEATIACCEPVQSGFGFGSGHTIVTRTLPLVALKPAK